jgi:endogenous inhibitor of DNA gyrase (YacG/DUF329 family)
MGLNPTIWGPHGWFFLHSIALNYPKNPTDKDKENYKIFFQSIQNILPCPQCAKHYSENLKTNPIESKLDNNISLNKWLVEMHNIVNRHYYKPTITYEEFIKNYKYIYNNQGATNIFSNSNNHTIILLSVIICILFGLFIYKQYK